MCSKPFIWCGRHLHLQSEHNVVLLFPCLAAVSITASTPTPQLHLQSSKHLLALLQIPFSTTDTKAVYHTVLFTPSVPCLPVQVQQKVFWCLCLVVFTPERWVCFHPAGLNPQLLLLRATPHCHDDSRRVLPLVGIFSAEAEELRLLVFDGR